MHAVDWYEAPMTLAIYIGLVAVAAIVSLASLAAAGVLCVFALAIVWRHELRSYSPTLPHTG
jgi:glycerol-3-phosphate acyltransferase PlsY